MAASSNLKLNRQQLAQFLPNPEAIKAFEQLFSQVYETAPTDLDSVKFSADTAQIKAAEALGQLASLANALSLALYGIYTEPTSQDCHFVSNEIVKEEQYVPPNSNGTLAEQNADNVNIKGGKAVGLSTVGTNNVAFPATQVPSADPNTLDDYEEGTWTPNQGSGVTVVGTFSSSGTYTKIGRLVFITGFMQGSTSIAVAAYSILTSNLPFASAVDGPVGRTISANLNITCDVFPSGSNVYVTSGLSATAYLRFSLILSI